MEMMVGLQNDKGEEFMDLSEHMRKVPLQHIVDIPALVKFVTSVCTQRMFINDCRPKTRNWALLKRLVYKRLHQIYRCVGFRAA